MGVIKHVEEGYVLAVNGDVIGTYASFTEAAAVYDRMKAEEQEND